MWVENPLSKARYMQRSRCSLAQSIISIAEFSLYYVNIDRSPSAVLSLAVAQLATFNSVLDDKVFYKCIWVLRRRTGDGY